MNVYVEVLLRSLMAFVALFVIAEILGAKQISQLTFFDYIVGITIGSIAGAMCMDDSIPLWQGFVGLLVFAIMSLVVSIINRKTIWGRRIFTGNPIFLISNGTILYKGLRRAQFNVNDLLRELRSQGYFDIADVHHAILETNGMVSILPKADKRPVVTSDMQLEVEPAETLANVIIDGKPLEGNLHAHSKDIEWLKTELSNANKEMSEVLLATLDKEGCLTYYEKDMSNQKRTVFE